MFVAFRSFYVTIGIMAERDFPDLYESPGHDYEVLFVDVTATLTNPPDDVVEDYREIAARRSLLLGPSADVHHPDYGLRENDPDEDFKVTYDVKTFKRDPSRVVVVEKIFNAKNVLVAVNKEDSKKNVRTIR